jgi:hypothetical protein
MDPKAVHERRVFLEFARAAGFTMDHGTVDSREPPEPDIRCRLGGQTVYFELGRLLDHGMQRLRLRLLRGSSVSVGDEDVRLPEREMLRQKRGKTYVLTSALDSATTSRPLARTRLQDA